jgi:hypothetical protein
MSQRTIRFCDILNGARNIAPNRLTTNMMNNMVYSFAQPCLVVGIAQMHLPHKIGSCVVVVTFFLLSLSLSLSQ